MTTLSLLTIGEGKRLFSILRKTNVTIPCSENPIEKTKLEEAYLLYEETISNGKICNLLGFAPENITQEDCHALIKIYCRHPEFYETLKENCQN